MFHNSRDQEAQDPASTDQMSRKACSPGYVKTTFGASYGEENKQLQCCRGLISVKRAVE